MKSNAHWNDLKFQLKKRNIKKNSFCCPIHKLYIKDKKQACNFVGNLKLKPIDYVAFFDIQE